MINLDKKTPLTPEQFIEIQLKLGWSNPQTAMFFSKSPQTVSNWRNGIQSIPLYVNTMLNNILEKYRTHHMAGLALRAKLQAEWEQYERDRIEKQLQKSSE